MGKNIFIKIGIGIIIVIGGWIIFSNIVEQFVIQKEAGGLSVQDNIGKETVLISDNGEEEPQIFKAEAREGMTAFDLLKNKADESNLVLKTKTYDIGILIEAIGEKENGQDGKYWLYYVNGEMASVSADKKEIKPGDKIEFKFEKSPF
jgi:hypothetical protein